jgi:hypothetical protein
LRIISIQKRLFDEIAEKLPPHRTLVDVVSDLLEISSAAAYRRIRGDKTMDIADTTVPVPSDGLTLRTSLGTPAAGECFPAQAAALAEKERAATR